MPSNPLQLSPFRFPQRSRMGLLAATLILQAYFHLRTFVHSFSYVRTLSQRSSWPSSETFWSLSKSHLNEPIHLTLFQPATVGDQDQLPLTLTLLTGPELQILTALGIYPSGHPYSSLRPAGSQFTGLTDFACPPISYEIHSALICAPQHNAKN